MSVSGAFLGIVQDLADAVGPDARVRFWPREKLLAKALALLRAARAANSLSPGDASKLRGMLGFLATAMWEGVGRAAMGPVKQRQCSDTVPWPSRQRLASEL